MYLCALQVLSACTYHVGIHRVLYILRTQQDHSYLLCSGQNEDFILTEKLATYVTIYMCSVPPVVNILKPHINISTYLSSWDVGCIS